MRHRTRARLLARVAPVALALGLGALMVPANVANAAGTSYKGSANSDIVHVKALNIPNTIQLAELGVAPSSAEMNSAGVPGGGKAHAHATNIDADVLSGTLAAQLIVSSDHRAPSTVKGPDVHELLNVPLDPILNADVARTTALSRWNSSGCITPGVPISESKSELADANVLTNTPLGMALAAVDNKNGDTVYSDSSVGLVNVPGQDGKGVLSQTTTQVTGVTLFKGTANQLTINVLAPPHIEAVATGKPGGASVTYSEPILQVVDANGDSLGELNAADAHLDLDASPLVHLKLGTLEKKVAQDGTSAEGSAVLLEVTVLDAPGAIEPLLRLTIAGGSAAATAPTGGVDCSGGTNNGDNGGNNGGNGGDCGADNPLKELQVGPSTLRASAGSTFTYTISVSNRGNCVLNHVKVDDTINGPPDSSVTGTSPKADTVDGLHVIWNDIGPLNPGQVKVLVITVKVPDGITSGHYKDDVDATATGGGKNFEQTVTVEGPDVGNNAGACNLEESKAGASHKEVKPGETFNVYVSLLNSGSAPCPGVTVTLPIDDDLTFVSCTFDCSNTDKTIKWTIDTLAPGESKTLTATLKVPDNAPNGEEFHHVVTIIDGGTITRTADGPKVTGNSVLAPFPAAGGDVEVGGVSELPTTGMYIGSLVLLALALIGAGEFLRRRGRASQA